ncbi:hypothetical protein Gogos_000962, partial [Gossypium gossypioides]|nr:hypothetical protein [Gossypium gossypioides]
DECFDRVVFSAILKLTSAECGLASNQKIFHKNYQWVSGDFENGEDKISLLEEELLQLSMKSSLVVLSENPSLICSVWTRKSYNPNSFRAQMKSIWKRKKKFEIQVVGQNLFLISFEDEKDLELILEGYWSCPLECDKKDLMHVIGTIFGGLIQ